MSTITFPAAGDTLRGYLATPEGDGPWPGVIVLHEMFGLNDDIRVQADRFAAEGYLAVAPDLYSAGSRLRCLRRGFQDLARGSGPTFDHIDGARAWLAAREDCTGRTGVVGFCMGGGFALLAAARAGYSAAAVNYGALPRRAVEVLAGACPVVASYGGRDLSLRGAAARLDRTLTELGVVHDVKEYAGAGHSFLNDATAPAPLNLFLRVVMRQGHAEQAAADAWDRMLAFFEDHVKDDPAEAEDPRPPATDAADLDAEDATAPGDDHPGTGPGPGTRDTTDTTAAGARAETTGTVPAPAQPAGTVHGAANGPRGQAGGPRGEAEGPQGEVDGSRGEVGGPRGEGDGARGEVEPAATGGDGTA